MGFFAYNRLRGRPRRFIRRFPLPLRMDGRREGLETPATRHSYRAGTPYNASPSQPASGISYGFSPIPGAQSFKDLRTIDDVLQPTFRNACLAAGLLDNDAQ